uniref:Uncharacterized protein n=1 Tax=viral metagenome TaxID=1070528 RepID=A0A6M3LQ45_9ZZZZ
MTELEAMRELVGHLVTVTERTHTGTRTIVGVVATPMLIEETEAGEEVVTLVTVEGIMVAEHITGLPLPLEPETPVVLRMVPVETLEMLA